MDELSLSQISKAGMTFERNRVELASLRLAHANVAYGSSAEAIQSANKLSLSFAQLIGLPETSVDQNSIRTVHDPSHPLSNSDGNIFMVDIDPIKEMATLVSAVRAYEANIRAHNTNGEMNKAALRLGENR